MKYKFWWMALVGISAYFGAGLVLLMATGATYLYHPVVAEGAIQAEQKLAGLVFGQFFLALVFGIVAGVVAMDGDHLK